jgi:hypothetical protein
MGTSPSIAIGPVCAIRLRSGRTGSPKPASSPISADHGPAAQITHPVSTRPLDVITAPASIPVTLLCVSTRTPCARAAEA